MKFPFRRQKTPLLDEAEILKQRGLDHLIGYYPAEYVKHATERLNNLPNGGSRLPWKYTRQALAALDAADDDLIANHPREWQAILDVLRMSNITPEDIINETP
jgi:hypothetical protein